MAPEQGPAPETSEAPRPKRLAWTIVKASLSGIAAILLGFFGFLLLFADLGPGETFFSRYSITLLFHLAFGFVLGLINPRAWPVSGLVAWGGFLITIRSALDGPGGWPDAITVAALAPLPALGGGYLGAWLMKRKRRRP